MSVRQHAVALVESMWPAMRERAVVCDREARFPFENYAEFRANGLLGLCIPERYGGMGASYADYVRVGEAIGRVCGATALTFNMHTITMLWAGQIADLLEMTDADREAHESRRAAMFGGVVEHGHIHSQPFSEGIAAGETAGYATSAVPTEGGWLVSGKKIFASLSGAAHFYNVTCHTPGEDEVRMLGVPADGEGIELVDDWDPLGMRGTVSRTLIMRDVFVPFANERLPYGMFNQAAARYPWSYLSLCPSYLGVTRGIVDVTAAYLRGELPGQTAGARRDHPIKQQGWATMQIKCEQSAASLYRVIDECSTKVDPTEAELVAAWAAAVTVMEHAAEVASLAIRVCGGQSMFKWLPLERMYRDARLGSLMLPWSVDVCLTRLGRARLYDD